MHQPPPMQTYRQTSSTGWRLAAAAAEAGVACWLHRVRPPHWLSTTPSEIAGCVKHACTCTHAHTQTYTPTRPPTHKAKQLKCSQFYVKDEACAIHTIRGWTQQSQVWTCKPLWVRSKCIFPSQSSAEPFPWINVTKNYFSLSEK